MYFYPHINIYRLNSRVLNPDSSKNLRLVNQHEFITKQMNYVTFTKKSNINPITHWIVGDFSKLSAFKLIKNTFEHLVSFLNLIQFLFLLTYIKYGFCLCLLYHLNY